MELILDSVTKFASNLVLMSVVPVIWWLFGCRNNKKSFIEWAGLHKPSFSAPWWHALTISAVSILLSGFDWTIVILSSDIAVIKQSGAVSANAYAGLAWKAVIPAFIENFLANGFCEELFFRGFLTKQLVSKTGVNTGIIVQAVLFGLVHNILCLVSGAGVSYIYHIIMFLTAGTAGLFLGTLSEKYFSGSIIPGIILHGLVNFIATMRVAF